MEKIGIQPNKSPAIKAVNFGSHFGNRKRTVGTTDGLKKRTRNTIQSKEATLNDYKAMKIRTGGVSEYNTTVRTRGSRGQMTANS